MEQNREKPMTHLSSHFESEKTFSVGYGGQSSLK